MLSKITAAAVQGIHAIPVTVEIDISRGLPSLTIVGQADTTVKEAKERIRSAISNSDLDYPKGRMTINMSPAGVRKKGSHFDLAMAVGILVASKQVFDREIHQCCFIGELSLDGSIHSCKGVLPMVIAARKAGIKKVIIPEGNREEASLVQEVKILPVNNLHQVIEYFNLKGEIKAFDSQRKVLESPRENSLDFADVKGQAYAKRAITVAVAGGHGILMMGSPSSGKTMISERIPTIMPRMTDEEILDDTVIYSVAGFLDERNPYIVRRPFRQPHHKITAVGLIGGGVPPRPGEITLANHGVLFLDEVGEFDRNLIDVLRVPLEKKIISITRRGETTIFPADFMLVAATNPCKCGYFGDSQHPCQCSQREINHYRSKLSGPILDRIDLHIHLRPISYMDISGEKTASSFEMREMIQQARERQRNRYSNLAISLNHQLDDRLTPRYCSLDEESEGLLSQAYSRLKLNPRTLLKIRKIARTIADLEGSEDIGIEHLSEALQYREIHE